jgi:hypothetical protein
VFNKKLIICIFACLMQACTLFKNDLIEIHRPNSISYNDCYEIGIEKYESDGNLGFYGRANRLIEINLKCDNLVRKYITRVDVPCIVNNFESKCDDVIMIARRNTSGYISQTPVTLNAAMRMEWFKTLKDQDELKVVFKENIEGRAIRELEQSRLEKEKKLTAQKQEQERVAAENLKRDQEEERKRYAKWLLSPEGKKYLENESAKEKKAEIDRLEADTRRLTQIDVDRLRENSRRNEMKRECLRINAWTSDSAELVARALKVSVASVSFVRPEWDGSIHRCQIIVDTSKGPFSCQTWDIVNRKDTIGNYTRLAFPGAVQAYCMR